MWPYRRSLAPHEHQSGVDVPDLDYAQTLSQERMVAAWHPLRALHVDALLGLVRAGVEKYKPGDATWLARIELPVLDPARLVAGVELAIDEGRLTALDEAERQAPALAQKAREASLPYAEKRIRAYAASAERLLAASLVQTASREAFRLTATTAQVDTVEAVAAVLGEQATRYEQDILQGMATGGVNEGRYHVMEAITSSGPTSELHAAASDTPLYAFYALEILDGNTCDACAEIDGMEYATLEQARVDYPGVGGGYVGCLGRERCRGALVIVYNEAGPTVPPEPVLPPPTPPPVPPPPPPPPPAPVEPAPEPPIDWSLVEAELGKAEAERALAGMMPGTDEYGLLVVDTLAPTAEREAAVRVAVEHNGAILSAAYGEKLARAVEAMPPHVKNMLSRIPEELHSAHLPSYTLEKIYKETMSEHGITLAAPTDLRIRKNFGVNALRLKEPVENGSALYPKAWIEKSNLRGALGYSDRGRAWRARYNPREETIELNTVADRSTIVHEIMHHMENIWSTGNRPEQDLARLEREFLLSRREPGEKLLRRGRGADAEYFMGDKFAEKYVGRVYAPDRKVTTPVPHYEVMSHGLQTLIQPGTNTTALGRQDEGLRSFVLGVLATLR